MQLPSHILPAWEKLLVAFPDLTETIAPIPKLAGSAFPRWHQRLDPSPRIALRPTPDALELWAGEIEDASTCVLTRATGTEPSVGVLTRALGVNHPLSGCFAIRFLASDPESCWPARPLLKGAAALEALSPVVRTLDLYPQGLGARLSWEAAAPRTVEVAMAACAEFVRVQSNSTELLDPFVQAQAVFDEAEVGAEAASDGSTPPLAGYRARFTRNLLGTLSPLVLTWIAGIGFFSACFSAWAAVGHLLPGWFRAPSTDSPTLSGIFAILFAWAAFAAYRALQRHRTSSQRLPWTLDHPWPGRGPLTEDWMRDLGFRLLIALLCLTLGTLIMTPAALEESEAACFNVGLGVATVLVGATYLLRALALAGRIVLRGPGSLWLEPYPVRPGAAFTFRVRIPGRRRLPVLHATLRGYQPRMLETDESHVLLPKIHLLRSTALEGPVAEPGGWAFRGGFAIPDSALPSAHMACPGTYWELTIHGPRARRHPDMCFLIPVYQVVQPDQEPDQAS